MNTSDQLAGDISKILKQKNILFLDCVYKNDALDMLIKSLSAEPEISDSEDFRKGIFYRETLMSTGIGLGIAVPHVRLDSISDVVMAVGICQTPLTDYDSIDGSPVQIVFMIAAGKEQHPQYLRLLASISRHFKDSGFKQELLESKSTAEVHNLLSSNSR